MDRAGATLLTIIDIGKNQLVVTADWIQQCIKHYEDIDDVFQRQFLQAIIFSGGQSDSSQRASSRLRRAMASLFNCRLLGSTLSRSLYSSGRVFA